MVNPLARVVMNNVIKKTDDFRPYVDENKVANITSKEEKLLMDIVNRDKQIKNYGKKPNMITLDEVAKRIKESR